jgi:hypothetical protein
LTILFKSRNPEIDVSDFLYSNELSTAAVAEWSAQTKRETQKEVFRGLDVSMRTRETVAKVAKNGGR